MSNQNELLEKKELRDRMVGRVNVLNKVKGLLLLPNTEYATKKQVAEYYEIQVDAIESIERRNKEELLSDGYGKFSSKDIKTLIGQTDGIKIPNTGMNLFPRRAILRVGMLLRDSVIAKEVRTQLLNLEEKTTDEQKVMEIDKEKELLMNIMFAKDDIVRAIAVNEYEKYMDRYKKKAEYHDKVLRPDKLITVTDVAKDLSMSARKLNSIMNKAKVIYPKRVNGKIKCWYLYKDYEHMIPEYADYHINEHGQNLKFTEKGRKWILENIKKWESTKTEKKENEELPF